MVRIDSVIRSFRKTRLSYWLKQGWPWPLAGVLLTYLFVTSDWTGVLRAFREVHLLPFILILLGYFVIQLVVDCWGIVYSLKQFGIKVPFAQVCFARGTASLLAVGHYAAGQGMLAHYLCCDRYVSSWVVASVILFMSVVDFFCVVCLAFLSALGLSVSTSSFLLVIASYVLWVGTISFIGLVVFLGWWRVIIPRANFIVWPVRRTLVWMRRNPLFSSFKHANIIIWVRVVLARIPVHLGMVFFAYLALRTFTKGVPLQEFMLVYPLSLLLAILPITPAGLGTTQVATVELLRDFASREVLVAYSILWTMGILVLKVMMGFYCLYKRR